MEATNICVYAKYGKCKKDGCQFHHPQETCCKKSCDIYSCLKKHPHYCRYFWGFHSCKFDKDCKFLHNDNIKNDYEANIAALEEKCAKLEEKYSNLEGRHKKLFNEVNFKNIEETATTIILYFG